MEENGRAASSGRRVTFTARQLQVKFRHALDFGVVGPYSRARADEFAEAVRQHVEATTTLTITATFRQTLSVRLYVDPDSSLMVMTDHFGAFISGWLLSEEQLKNVLERGTL